jgi:DNA-binding transcriptional MerR regulator
LKLEDSLKEFSQKNQISSFPTWNDIPEIDLYMDQVIALMEKYLSNLTFEDDNTKLITSSMINNYVKLNIIPPPTKKKYSREHIAYLLIICSLKQVMPIPKIKEVIDLKLKTMSIEELLNSYSELYKKTFDDTFVITENFFNENKKNKDSLLDTALFLAIFSSNSRYISESILKIQTQPEENSKKSSSK